MKEAGIILLILGLSLTIVTGFNVHDDTALLFYIVCIFLDIAGLLLIFYNSFISINEDKRRSAIILVVASFILFVLSFRILSFGNFSFGLFSLGMILIIFGITLYFTDRLHKKARKWPLVIGSFICVHHAGRYTTTLIAFNTIEGQRITFEMTDNSVKALSYREGMQVTVRYNPENPKKNLITRVENEEALKPAFYGYLLSNYLIKKEEIDIVEYGVKTVGVILSAQVVYENELKDAEKFYLLDFGINMILQISVTRPETGSTYCVTKNMNVSKRILPFVQPGSVVEVYCMPDDESAIVVGMDLYLTLLGLPKQILDRKPSNNELDHAVFSIE
ncbi:MAG: DUF3592 domain-containing protein [Azoarcus sp.]|jgi:hypothetical protein|nr:DUF3592 domain-containing protein [Azoarcus sp.]